MNAEQLLSAINTHIAGLSFHNRQPRNLYEPMTYLLSLKGKRIRPLLTLMAYHAASGKSPLNALNIAAATELFHNFTLMHDDIMDKAPLRRNMPTVHVKWDENIAILSGDALFAYTMELIVQDFPEKAAPLIRLYTQTSLGVCEGQMEDMDLALANEVTIADYIEMIRKKTAVLLGGSLAMGAVAGGASDEVAQLLQQFGEAVGIGFQLQDDLMDAFPPKDFGKQIGGDIIENKKTYLILRALELASPEQLERLVFAYTHEEDNEAKVATVVGIFRELHIEAHTTQMAQGYFAEAQRLADALEPHLDMTHLRSYLAEIVDRKI